MKLKRIISAVVSAAIVLSSVSVGMVLEVAAAADELVLFEGSEHIDAWDVVAGNPDTYFDIPQTLSGSEFEDYENLSITFCFSQTEIDQLYPSNQWKADKTFEIMIKANDTYTAGPWSWLDVTDDTNKCGYGAYGLTLTAGQEHTIKFPTATILSSLADKYSTFDAKTMSNAVVLKMGWVPGATVKKVAFTDPSVTYSYQDVDVLGNWGVFPGTWDFAKINSRTQLIINYTASNAGGWPGFKFIDSVDDTEYTSGGFSEGTNDAVVNFSDMIANGFAAGKNLKFGYWDNGATITINSFKIKNEESLGNCYALPIAVSGVSITDSATAFEFKKGSDDGFAPASTQFSAVVSPDNADDKSITWSSSDETVATVTADGTVTPVAIGTATITATSVSDNTKKATRTVNITPIAVTGITLGASSLNVTGLDVITVAATIAPDNAYDKSIEWNSSDTAVATVSNGTVTFANPTAEKTVAISAKQGSITSNSLTFTVSPKVIAHPVTGVTISDKTASVIVGNTKQLSATVAPADADVKTVQWTTSDDKIATVGSSGLITAVGVGTATITVKTVEGDFTDTCALTVTPVKVTGITLSDDKASAELGTTKQLSATIAPENATDKTAVWTSSDATIATVDNNGLVTAVAVGKTTITVKTNDGSFTDTCEFTVTEAKPTAVTILIGGTAPSEDKLTLTEGKTKEIAATVTPEKAPQTVEFTVADDKIVTVKDGVLTAVAVGETTVTAKAGEVTKTITVKVTEKPKFPYTSDEGVVLFEGEGKANAWGQAATVYTIKNDDGIVDPAILTSTSAVKVYYTSDSVPELIFQSWSGGEGWAKVAATATETGIAYYSYADFSAAYKSTDFSSLDAINAGATASALTVTKVVVIPTYPVGGGSGTGGSSTGGSGTGGSGTGTGTGTNESTKTTEKTEDVKKALEEAVEEVINGEKTKVVKATAEAATETIAAALEAKTEGEKVRVSVDMSENKTVGKDVIEAIKGTDASVELKMKTDDGVEYSWVIDGSTVDEDFNMDDLDMSIAIDKSEIPAETVEALKDTVKAIAGDDVAIIPLTLNHNGAFGFTPVLNVSVGAEMAGKAVVLTYYNPETGKMEIMGEPAIVDEFGNVSVKFYHASEYVLAVVDPEVIEELLASVTVSNEPEAIEEEEEPETIDEEEIEEPEETEEPETDNIEISEPETEEVANTSDSEESNKASDDKTTNPNTGFVLAVFPAAIAGAVTFISKKRKK